MSQDDPFSSLDSDRTIIVPSPGNRAPPQARAVPAAESPSAMPSPSENHITSVSGMNPLLAAANPLLDMVPQLRATLQHPDPLGLRDSLARDIKEFERRARGTHVAGEKIVAARYALCTLLDEIATSTPWGGSGMWAKNSLLITFHNEAWGGEKFFQLLSKLAEQPDVNRDLLELMYVCLALGFEGRYRVLNNGRAQLDAIRERLAQLLRKQQGDYERDLSPRWQVALNKRGAGWNVLPVWVAVAVCGLVLLGVYLPYSYLLNAASDPVFSNIYATRVATAAPRPAAPTQRLAPFLAKEIAEGLVAVHDDERRSVVTIRGDGLFAAGSASIAPGYQPLLVRIAQALNSVGGKVQITGHTDNQPIRSTRFPSNWHLSQERARSVMQLLATTVASPGRLSAEGRADTEPIALNDTPANRARNRRVEITLIPAHTGT